MLHTLRNKFIFFTLIIIVAYSCSNTKYVPEGKYLLNASEIKVDGKGVSPDEIVSYVKQKPNKRIFFVRFHLGLYDLSSPSRNNGISGWLKRIGEEPVIYDSYLHTKSMEQVGLFLNSKGYYNYLLHDTLIYSHKKTVKEVFNITLGKPYTIDDVALSIPDSVVYKLVLSDTINKKLVKGIPFDKDILEDERDRITSMLRNHGYYKFNKNFITYTADTSLGNKKVALTMKISNFPVKTADGKIIRVPHQKYRISQVNILTDYDGVKAITDSTYMNGYDTIPYKGLNILNRKIFKLKPSTIYRADYIMPDSLFSERDVNNTYNNFSSLRLFRNITFQFEEKPKDKKENKPSSEDLFEDVVVGESIDNHIDTTGKVEPKLTCNVLLLPVSQQSYTLELEGTNSSGDYGIAGNLGYQHKNLFKGAESFEAKFKEAVEVLKQTASNTFGTSVETGVYTTLNIPRFLMPFHIDDARATYNPKTQFSLSYNFQRRPDYTRTIVNYTFGYKWNQTKNITMVVNPIDVNIVNLPVVSASFLAQLNDDFLRNSYQNHLVAGASYSFIYSKNEKNRPGNSHYFRVNADMAGNLLSMFSQIFSEPKLDGSYRVLGTQYAQYIRGEVTYVYHQVLNEANTFVYRAYAGIGVPYGNSKVLPLERQFFAGGANSNRGWQVRSLGPGSYHSDSTTTYPSVSSDMKLEANFEYRFKLIWKMEGAYFIDAGNIWAIDAEDTRPGAQFDIKRFYKEIAIGTGLGIRFNFGFFIFRIDAGIKAYDPSLPLANRWVLGTQPLTFNDVVFHFGINYPF
ncbi:MAG TPA: BamA/TamA family outer membrane protein [Williamwhitmania sp.]|nr:BamA/TamA family outer membrane protein [Williamwhitmania sp.]